MSGVADDLPAPTEPLGLPLDRAEQMLPAGLLQRGETVLLICKPSPFYILLDPLGYYVLIVSLTAAAWALATANWPWWLAWLEMLQPAHVLLAGGGLLGVRLVWATLQWLSRLYVLTDRRVIRRLGVLRTFTFQAHLQQVQHTQLIRRLRERLFGLGTIGVATAGTGLNEAFWEMLAQPYAVHQRLIDALRGMGGEG